MPQLSEMVGQTIVTLVPIFDKVKLQRLKLHGVEAGGIWVENQEITNQFLSQLGVAASPRTPVFFLPYQQIALVMASLDVPGLSEKAFGV